MLQTLPPQAQLAHDNATAPEARSGLLPQSDRAWRADPLTPHFFGRTHHTATPSAWAIQVLGYNITAVLVGHIQCGISNSNVHMERGAVRYTPGQDLRFPVGASTDRRQSPPSPPPHADIGL